MTTKIIQSIAENIPLGIIYIDINHNVIFCNKIMEDAIYRRTKKKITLGNPLFPDFVTNDNIQRYLQSFKTVLNGTSIKFENAPLNDNFFPWFEFEMSPVYDENYITGVTLISNMIVDEKISDTRSSSEKSPVESLSAQGEMYTELVELGEKFKKLSQKLNIGIFEFEISNAGQMALNYASSTFSNIYFGKELDVLVRNVNTIFDMIHHDDIQLVYSAIERSSQSLDDMNIEYRIEQNGQTKWLNCTSFPRRTSYGSTVWYGVVEDVSKQRRNEAELIALGNKLKRLTQKIEIGIYEFSISLSGQMKMTFVNEAYEKIFFGENIESILKDAGILFSYVHPDDIDLINATLQASMENLSGWDIEYRIKKDDEIKWIKGIATPERNNDGSTTWYGYIKDVTERKREYLRLKLLESVITNTNDMVVITEAEPIDLSKGGPKILYANRAFTEITGYSQEEIIDKTPRILQGLKSNRIELDKLKESMKQWRCHTVEIINYKKNGAEFWNNFTLVPVADEKGWFTHWISIERDVSHYKKQQEELEVRNKLLEKIAFHHSHVLRAPVARLLGLVNILVDFPDENTENMLNNIYKCAEEIDVIIKEMASS